MNQRTEPSSPTAAEKPRLFPEMVCAIILAGILLFWSGESMIFFLNPWLAAAGATLRSTMEEFGGRTPSMPDPGERSMMLLGLLAGFVIAPSIFLLSWRKIRLGGLPQSFLASLFVVVGGAVTLAAVIPPAVATVRLELRSPRQGEEREIQSAKANLMYGLDAIAVDARTYRVLPAAKGGGNGSYAGYKIPERLRGDASTKYEIASGGSGMLRLTGSAPMYAGSSVTLELDSTRSRFTYDGLFKP